MPRIEVTIDKKTNAVRIETFGYSGGACLKAVEGLKAALGGDVVETPKPEMFDADVVVEDARFETR